jgi:diguanylate cyclase (GGDEF)-like protein
MLDGGKITSKVLIILVCLILAGLIGLIDYASGYQISFAIFYLIPILLVVWYLNRFAGIVASIVGTVIWAFADHLSGHQYDNILILFWNAGVRLGFFLIIVLAISRIKLALEKEQASSRLDFLTNIANRKGLLERMKLEIERARRYPEPISLAYIDLDNFKAVNDGFGHATGDELLSTVAGIIKSNIRASDLSARMGGDEFAILLPMTRDEDAREVVARIQQKLKSAMEEKSWPVSFSIGLVIFANPPGSADEFIREADKIMYTVKKNAKGELRWASRR